MQTKQARRRHLLNVQPMDQVDRTRLEPAQTQPMTTMVTEVRTQTVIRIALLERRIPVLARRPTTQRWLPYLALIVIDIWVELSRLRSNEVSLTCLILSAHPAPSTLLLLAPRRAFSHAFPLARISSSPSYLDPSRHRRTSQIRQG